MAKQERNIITDKLVIEKTGKALEDWFLQLDAAGAKELTPTALYQLVATIDGLQPLGEWNQNLLATSYAWSRGIRERGEKANGFEVSISKTIQVPVAVLYQSWVDDAIRNRWLPEKKMVIRKATENKSVRVTWVDGMTSLSVDFYAKGADKAQVVVQHLKLPDSTAAAEKKVYWQERLETLKTLLE